MAAVLSQSGSSCQTVWDRTPIHKGGILLWEEPRDVSSLRGNKTARENNLLWQGYHKNKKRKGGPVPFSLIYSLQLSHAEEPVSSAPWEENLRNNLCCSSRCSGNFYWTSTMYQAVPGLGDMTMNQTDKTLAIREQWTWGGEKEPFRKLLKTWLREEG